MTQPSHTKRTLGILGGAGMLGSDLAFYLADEYEVVPIDKDDYSAHKGRSFDVLLNANGNSRRFWADGHPYDDFIASTASVYSSLCDFSYGTYIYISSGDVYADHSSPLTTREDREYSAYADSPYGFHKRMSELIVQVRAPRWLILRSSMMLGRKLRKGPIFDLLRGDPVFVSPDSKLQMITTEAIADIVRKLLEKDITGEIFNMGGEGAVYWRDAANLFDIPATYVEHPEIQKYELDVAKIKKIYPIERTAEYLQNFVSMYNNKTK